MDQLQHLLPDPCARFSALYEELSRHEHGWALSPWLRFAAYAAVLTPGDPPQVATAIRVKADLLQRHAAWYGALSSPLRFAIAGTLVQNHCLSRRFEHQMSKLARKLASEHVHAGQAQVALMTAIAGIMEDGEALSALHVARLAAFHRESQKHHLWPLGSEDLPSCLLLSYRPGLAKDLIHQSNALQQRLSGLGPHCGHTQRHASRLLLLCPLGPEEAYQRFTQLLRCYREYYQSVSSPLFEVLASLTLLDQEPALIIKELMRMSAGVVDLKPEVQPEIGEVLAGDLTMLSLVRLDASQQLLTTSTQHLAMFQRLRLHQATSLLLACDAMADIPTGTPLEPDLMNTPLFP